MFRAQWTQPTSPSLYQSPRTLDPSRGWRRNGAHKLQKVTHFIKSNKYKVGPSITKAAARAGGPRGSPLSLMTKLGQAADRGHTARVVKCSVLPPSTHTVLDYSAWEDDAISKEAGRTPRNTLRATGTQLKADHRLGFVRGWWSLKGVCWKELSSFNWNQTGHFN